MLLQRVYAHLHADDLFAFETRNPLLDGVEHPEGFFVRLTTRNEEEAWPSLRDNQRHEVLVTRTRVYDHVTQVLYWTTYRRCVEHGDERVKVARIALRYTFPQELTALLHYNGFQLVRQYGDWNLEPLSATSRSIIVVCRKATRPNN